VRFDELLAGRQAEPETCLDSRSSRLVLSDTLLGPPLLTHLAPVMLKKPVA